MRPPAPSRRFFGALGEAELVRARAAQLRHGGAFALELVAVQWRQAVDLERQGALFRPGLPRTRQGAVAQYGSGARDRAEEPLAHRGVGDERLAVGLLGVGVAGR